MEKQHIITISGKPGSGKSSTADAISELLGYTRHSSGDIVRKFITKYKMTLSEYNEQAKSNHSLDEAVDQQLRNLRDQSEIVIDSRLGFYWIPGSFKVYLDLDLAEATKRIHSDAISNVHRKDAGEGTSDLVHLAVEVRQRMEQEQHRFQNLYHVDPFSLKHFDLIIDTSNQTPRTVAMAIIEAYTRWQKSSTWQQDRNPKIIK